ncbi:MAG: carboxylating nicotinate-nucleotide diphosphorylase [Kiritimatiellia bacterium]
MPARNTHKPTSRKAARAAAPETWPETRVLITAALAEDVGTGDVTSDSLVVPRARATARMVARSPLVVAGIGIATAVFRAVDRRIKVTRHLRDGRKAQKGQVVLTATGPAASLLTAERTALNFVQRMSGVATLARRFVDEIKPHRTRILDTRKTIPGWRRLDKYAVACGGGTNHRAGLYDQVLIKDNHLAHWSAHAKGGTLAEAVREARRRHPGLVVEVEADTPAQVRDLVAARPDWILLDNMTLAQLRECVALCRGGCRTEASGGVNLSTVKAIAATGVDAISVGALTHSAPAADLALDFV